MTYVEDAARKALGGMWWPTLSGVNVVREPAIVNMELTVWPAGKVRYFERVNAEISAAYDFRKFPFDRQALSILVQPFAWNEQVVQFVHDAHRTGYRDDLQMPEWHIERFRPQVMSVGRSP